MSEILGLQWANVDEARGLLVLPAAITKTGVPRHAIISPRLQAVLTMRAAVQRATRELADDADLPGDLHPFGNELGERIKGIRTAWRLTYLATSSTRLRAAIAARDAARTNLAQPPKPEETPVSAPTVTH
jgi:integrase